MAKIRKIDRKELTLCVAKILYSHYKKKSFSKSLTISEIKKRLEKDYKIQVSDNIIMEAKEKAFEECLNTDINLKSLQNDDIENQLVNQYCDNGLEEAVVVDLYPDDSILDALGRKSAEFFEKNVKEGEGKTTVVLSCGLTINSMIDNINETKDYKNLRVISSIVLCVNSFQQISPFKLINNFTERFPGVEGYAYQIPEEVRNKISTDRGDKDFYNTLKQTIFDEALEADYFFLGIGSLSKQYEGLTGGFNSLVDRLECYENFKEMDCCGEISYWPVKKKPFKSSYWLKDYIDNTSDSPRFSQLGKKYFDHVYAIDFNEIIKRRKKGILRGKVVAVAGGPGKELPITNCLKTKNFLHTLITDSLTARKIINLSKTNTKRKNNFCRNI